MIATELDYKHAIACVASDSNDGGSDSAKANFIVSLAAHKMNEETVIYLANQYRARVGII